MNVFISYNRQNSVFVSSVIRSLQGTVSIIKELFFDQDNLQGGQVWTSEIQEAIQNSDACIVFIGAQGIGSWQNKEVLTLVNRYENSRGAFKLIPVIIPHNKNEYVQKSFPWFLADMQWIEFTNESDSDAFQKLTAALSQGENLHPIDTRLVPYKGLDFFGVEDAPVFFGRTFDVNWVFYKKLTLDLLSAVRFLAIVGDSGSGKSSFARAGILATIKAGRFSGSDKWPQIIFTPEDSPLLKLSAAFQSAGIVTDAARLETDARSDASAVRRALEIYGKRVIVLVDQFEELLTQCKDNKLREAFLENIMEALKSQHFVCIITMRSDFYAAFSPFRQFADIMEANNYTITSLDFNTGGEEWERYLRDIIQKPARLLGVNFDPSLVSQLLQDCKRINGVLPALQLALVELWKRRSDEKRIQSSDYDSLAQGKGIAGIIEAHANSKWKSLTKDETDKQAANLIKAIFIRLVEITGNKEDVRKTVNKHELVTDLSSQFKQADIEDALNTLSGPDVRLIRIKQDSVDSNGSWVEVIHEALIRQWELLRVWLNERREAISYRNKLHQYIDDDNKLYSGKKLLQAEQWINANKDLATTRIISFVEKSRLQVRKRRNAYGIAAAAVALVVLSGWLYKPVYECRNSVLVKSIVNGNQDLNEIHKLVLSGTRNIEFTRCLNNLDTLVITGAPGDNYLSQASVDLLPKSLRQLKLEGFGLSDSLLQFQSFNKLVTLELSGISGLQRTVITGADSLVNLQFTQLADFKNMTGLDKLNGLRLLSLVDLPKLTNFGLLASLKGITSLELVRLPLTSLDILAGLPELKELTLQGLNIPDLKGLREIENLRSLNLSVLPKVASLNGLEQLTKLRFLNVALHLDSMPELQALSELQTLTISEAKIADLALLGNLNKLKELTLSDLMIPNLNGIEHLVNLGSLTLSKLGITDLGRLKDFHQLQRLKLEQLAIADLSGIDSLPLRSLELVSCPALTGMAVIESLSSLQSLKLLGLSVAQLPRIEKNPKLNRLILSEIPINSLDEIIACKQLEELDISFLGIQDFTGIENLSRLHTLSLKNFELDLDGIERLPVLKNLSLANIPVKYIGVVGKMKNLSTLTLQNIVPSANHSLPVLSGDAVKDSLVLSAIKLDNLNFINDNLRVSNFCYDADLELANAETAFFKKAQSMKATRFVNLSLHREPENQ